MSALIWTLRRHSSRPPPFACSASKPYGPSVVKRARRAAVRHIYLDKVPPGTSEGRERAPARVQAMNRAADYLLATDALEFYSLIFQRRRHVYGTVKAAPSRRQRRH